MLPNLGKVAFMSQSMFGKYFFQLTTTAVLWWMFSLNLNAQTIQNSPYSYIGIGEEVESNISINHSMMGGLGVAASNGIYSNLINPALLARNPFTVFETSIGATIKNFQNARQRSQAFGGNYDYLNLNIPVSKRWNMSVGFRPYSDVNYETRSFRKLNVLGLDSLIYGYNGGGTLTKLAIANGFRIGKGFYIGLESSFLFGKIARSVSTQNISDGQYYKIQLENIDDYRSLFFKGGLAYRKVIKENLALTLGATYDITSDISATSLRRFSTYDINGINLINSDTLANDTPYDQAIPQALKFGISLEKQSNWMVGIDFISTDYSRITNYLGTSSELPVTSKVILGGEYIPDYTSVSNYLKNMVYRAGFSYSTTPYTIIQNGTRAKDMSVSIGFGLPLRNLSFLNIAVTRGKRGTVSENGLEEVYTKFSLGYTLNDKWFRKFKINY